MSILTGIANRIVFPTGDIVLGTHILRSLKELEEKQWLSADNIKIEQDETLCRLIGHCYENVPYWRDIFRQLGLKPSDIRGKEDLQKLPLLTKDGIRRNLSRMVAENVPKRRIRENHSSGSTGEPLKYYDDKDHYSWRIASVLRFWKWAGFEFGMRWSRISLWPHNRVFQKVCDSFARCLYISISKLDEQGIVGIIKKVKKYQPEIIRGYASAVYLLAEHARRNNVDGINPKAVITTGDNLFTHYRKLIEDQFKCRVYDTYGGEGMVIAGQCEKGMYHTDDNGLIVEYLRDDGSKAEPGELANIIVTDLRNHAMPFIRYRIQDLGRSSDEVCKCGRGLSVMQSIEGRDSDIIRVPGGRYLIVHFFTGLFEFIEGVDQFQVVQRSLDEIEIKIVRNEKLTEKDVQYIHDSIQKGGGENLKVAFNFVENIPLEKSGKRRFVISEI